MLDLLIDQLRVRRHGGWPRIFTLVQFSDNFVHLLDFGWYDNPKQRKKAH